MTKRTAIILFALTALIAAGFMQPFDPDTFERSRAFIFWLILVLVWLAPVFPITMLIVRLNLPKPMPPSFAQFFANVVLFCGLLLTIVLAVFAPTWLLAIHAGVLSLAVASSILTLSFGRLERSCVYTATAGLAIAAAAAVWSLATVPTAVLQANRLAGDAPFCLTNREGVGSLWDLRGFTLYSISEFESVPWYLHGILVVDATDGRRVYNWSPRRFRFDRLYRTKRFDRTLDRACKPIPDFWRTL